MGIRDRPVITSAIIDTREPKDTIQKMTFGGVPTLAMSLDAGDVMCTCDDGATILIERKTPGDFLSTLAACRLFPQVARMVATTPWSYILITGIFYRKRGGKVAVDGRLTDWEYNAIEGAKLTCQEMGCGVIHCADNDFEQAVIRLCNRDRSAKRVQPARETALLSEGEQAIAALPGIGYERVEALIKKLGSPARVLEWITDLGDATKVPGVADGTKRKVINALDLGEYRLSIMPYECREASYTPNGGFIAAADKAAMAYLEETANGN